MRARFVDVETRVENGTPVTYLTVDEITRYRELLQTPTVQSPLRDQQLFSSIVFSLPRSPRAWDVPRVVVYGNGMNVGGFHFHGRNELDRALEWVDRRPKIYEADYGAILEQMPNWEVAPFLHEGNYPPYGIRKYDVRVDPWGTVIRVASVIREDRDQDSLSITFIPRRGQQLQLASVVRQQDEWTALLGEHPSVAQLLAHL